MKNPYVIRAIEAGDPVRAAQLAKINELETRIKNDQRQLARLRREYRGKLPSEKTNEQL